MRTATATAGSVLRLAMLWFAVSLSVQGQGRFFESIDGFAIDPGDGSRLPNPCAGGLMAPRIGLIDLTGDGLPDLLTLNPDNRPRLYVNQGGFQFRRAPGTPYDSLPVRLWFRIVDLDDNGAADLLTGGAHSELLFYRNLGSTVVPLFGTADTLRHDTIIFTQQETVPSLVDIDNDGDLDLYSGNIEGTITFYRNIGTRKAPHFLLVSSRYEDIVVISTGTLGRDPGGSALQGSRHGASVLDFADIDGDRDPDLLFGDFFTTRLLLFHNDGTKESARFSMSRLDTAFRGIGDDVETLGFNQPAVADIDDDGDLDVLVSSLYPNSPFQPIFLYENIGTTTAPDFRKRPQEVTGELDLGAFSAPTRIDDRDHQGILVGTGEGNVYWMSLSNDATMPLLRREGRYGTIPGLFNAVPTAGDIDGDGRAEIIIGSADGNNLVLMRFQGSRLVQGNWQLDTFRAGRYSSPSLVDFDGDDDLDLLVGSSSGRVAWFDNVGTPTTPTFVPRLPPPPFDTLDIGTTSSPRMFDLDRDGDLDMILGARPDPGVERGIVRFFLYADGSFSQSAGWPDIETDISPIPSILPVPYGLAMLVGNRPGGLSCHIDSGYVLSREPEETSAETNGNRCRFVPNIVPGSGGAVRLLGVDPWFEGSVTLVDAFGREVGRVSVVESSVDLPPLPAGLYFARIGDNSPLRIVVAD